MARRKTSRVYRRGDRYWGDFRSLGGKREPLIPNGESLATADADVAEKLAGDRIAELEASRRSSALLGTKRQARLREFAAEHLIIKAESGKFAAAYLVAVEKHYERACEFFGQDRNLNSISVLDVRGWVALLRKLPNRRGETLSDKTVRGHLDSLSNLFRRAQSELCVPPGHNPVASMMDKPRAETPEAEWLEVCDAALYLEAAHRHSPPHDGIPFMYAIVATFLLTGGRHSEIMGLLVSDLNFERRTLTFRPNEHRSLKTKRSRRVVPLWPQLDVILREHIRQEGRVGGLLFPSPQTGGMIRDARKSLDTIGELAGWERGEIRMKGFRHTYTAARLQTLDRGAPVALYTVSRELGHASTAMVERVYSHLGDVRHRSEVVEYRVEQHEDKLGDRLTAILSG
ncbi:MAG: tyrosine-type recombinase/integrase [Gemmatimonadota bacterium]